MDFPIAEVSRHAAREKSIRHGHPSTLHLWWARRPLASCRAMLLALLWPDPCDPCCPADFKQKARELLPSVQGAPGPTDEDLRKALLKFIADFANWDLAAHPSYLEVSRALVRAAYPEEPPLVVDPFAGGGSIPLEALRVGCDAFASDLNPVACLILKVMLEDIPRHGPKLAEELRRVGAEIKREAEKELAEFYPGDPDGSTPIAYLWARTVRCESPNCGAEIPLVRSFWLCKKANRKRALRHTVVRHKGTPPEIQFEVFEPKSEKEVPPGTVTRAKAACPACNIVLPPERVRAQLAAQRGGADTVFDVKGRRTGGARLLAVVTMKPGEQGRHYRLPTEADYQAVWKAQRRLKKILDEWERGGRKGLSPVPDEAISCNELRRISVPIYGMQRWGDLFTARQKLTLKVLTELVGAVDRGSLTDALALVVDRVADQASSLVRWLQTIEAVASTFGRQALGMVWDFCETLPMGKESANLLAALDWVCNVIDAPRGLMIGQTGMQDAATHPAPDDSAHIWFTDPPYYDAVPYAHLSDFFFVWLKRSRSKRLLTAGAAHEDSWTTPKEREIVVDRPHRLSTSTKDARSYEIGIAKAFGEGRRVLRDDGVGSVVFAHKTTEGWEALLSGLIQGGWTITASWPVATERGSRLNARETASLATSVHLVCRPRPENAPTGDWAEVLRELPKRVGDWMERLESEDVRGADLVFACIGPALEIFSRYARVETADGREVSLAEYLEKVWEVVGRTALEQVLGTAEARARNGAAGAVEEDARLTALFLWTLQSTNGDFAASEESEEDEAAEDEDEEGAAPKAGKGYSLVFDVVRRFAQPLGINLPKWENRIIETRKGVVRLLAVSERAKLLFGQDGREAVADLLETDPLAATRQLALFPDQDVTPAKANGRRRRIAVDMADDAPAAQPEATTLDRVHAAMLLQAGGRTNALRALLKAEQERGPYFLRLANALSALYPKGSEEKRLLDAMLLAMPR
ncbi:MAG: DUF1156 domain-containing protein [bacterium]